MYLKWTLTNNELEQTYKQLCKEWHPDRNHDRDTTVEFQNIQSEYEQIKAYRANDETVHLAVSLTELYHGCIKDINVRDPTDAGPQQTLPVLIPTGTLDGTIINVVTPQYRTINIVVKEVNDTKFIRDGYNLIVHLDITLTQALVGSPVVMGHFNGTLKVPTQIPHTNYRHIVPGAGMPIPTASGSFGDLYVVYNLILPTRISQEFAHELFDLCYDP